MGRPVAVGRIGDVGPAQGADLAPPHAGHEEQSRDHGIEAAALEGDLVGLDPQPAPTRAMAGGEHGGEVCGPERVGLAATARQWVPLPLRSSLSVSTGASPRLQSDWPSQSSTRYRTRNDPVAVRAWAPSAAFRDAVRSVVLSTLELYVGIVEALADGDNGGCTDENL